MDWSCTGTSVNCRPERWPLWSPPTPAAARRCRCSEPCLENPAQAGRFPQLLQLVDQVLRQPLILVVDDDHDLCDSLWELFHDRNYRVCLAHDVPQAVHRLADQQFDVLLVDLKLPNGDGTQILDCLRQTNSQARSIMITGFRAETERRVQSALSQGAMQSATNRLTSMSCSPPSANFAGSGQCDKGVNAVGQ